MAIESAIAQALRDMYVPWTSPDRRLADLRKTVAELQKLGDDPDMIMTVELSDSKIRFTIGGVVLALRGFPVSFDPPVAGHAAPPPGPERVRVRIVNGRILHQRDLAAQ